MPFTPAKALRPNAMTPANALKPTTRTPLKALEPNATTPEKTLKLGNSNSSSIDDESQEGITGKSCLGVNMVGVTRERIRPLPKICSIYC